MNNFATPHPLFAFLAGIASFLSPCIFPLIPSYLSYIGGITYTELVEGKNRRFGVFIKTLFFILGFSIIFAVMGAFAWGFGNVLSGYTKYLKIAAGIIIIILGLHYCFDFLKFFNITKKFDFKKKPVGYIGAVLIGISFGVAWTPCTGPILAAILAVATTSQTTANGILLLLFYSAGIGIPFLLMSLFFSFLGKKMQSFTKFLKPVKIISGILLVLLGILIMAGAFEELNIIFSKAAYAIEEWRQINPVIARILGGIIFIIPAVPIIVLYIRKILNNKKEGITKMVYPVRIAWITLLLILSILCFIGIIDIAAFLFSWFNFSGL